MYPAVTDGEQATEEEDCLAKTLLDRLNIPKKPAQEEDDEPAATADGDEENSTETVEKTGDEKAGADVVSG